jgi:uroporphyrinogen decarboxylase
MMNHPPPDFTRIRRSLLLEGPPDRLPAMELVVDDEIAFAILGRPVNRRDAASALAFQVRMGYDYVNVYSDLRLDFRRTTVAADAAGLAAARSFVNEQDGPITTRAELAAYAWPDPAAITCRDFERARPLLPRGMKMIARCHGPFEWGTWLMGIQRFCMMLIEDRPLVDQVFARVSELIRAEVAAMVRQPDVGAVWISDDLGFNSGTFISPDDLARLVFPTYEEICRLARGRDLPVLLHSCGRLDAILGRLVDCGINALHSLPPGLYDFAQLKRDWGRRICLLGNVDVDLLSRGSTDDVRRAVRHVRDVWRADPPGGVILSSSNSIANYCRVENYLAMMDEGRKA